MAQRVYEGMYLLDSNRYARDSGGVSGRIGEMIEKCGGEVLVSRLWAEQRLAYPIEGHRKGSYWLVYFKMESSRLSELRRAAQLNNDVLRELVLTVHPHLVDALVAHARSGGRSSSTEDLPADSAAESGGARAEAAVEAAAVDD